MGSQVPVAAGGTVWPLLTVPALVTQGGGRGGGLAVVYDLVLSPAAVAANVAAAQSPDIEIVGREYPSDPQG